MRWYENTEAARYVDIFKDEEELERTARAAREHGWIVADTMPAPCAESATHVIVFHDGDRFDGAPPACGRIVTFVRTAQARH